MKTLQKFSILHNVSIQYLSLTSIF